MTRLLLFPLAAIGAVALAFAGFVVFLGWVTTHGMDETVETPDAEHDGFEWTYTADLIVAVDQATIH